MRIRILGRVEIATERGWTRAGPPKQSCVLAALALAGGKDLSHEALANRLWGTKPPPSARTVLYGHITRLRELLRPLPEVDLDRGSAEGYGLRLEPEAVDVLIMRRLASQARAAAEAGDNATAARLWSQAAELFRGIPLSGIEGDWAERMRTGLEREHEEVLVGRFDSELRMHRHDQVLAELAAALDRFPLSQPLVGLHMLGLYRSGRPEDALACYTQARHRLREETGTDPNSQLAELQQRILQADPALSGTPTAGPLGRLVPAQLPADTDSFTGRDTDLARIREQIRGRVHGNVVVAIDGMAGIGKTAFAVRLATELRNEYPDGQLFVDLHGFSPSLPPLPAAEALARLLSGLGVSPAEAGETADERGAALRSALADRRLLIVLDNATDEAQVRPLLPGASHCLVLVTSRRRLAGLDDARLCTLDVLHRYDAIRLFNTVSERDLTNSDTRVGELVDLCGRLPLAIRIAATRLRSRRSETVDRLRDRLADETRRLSELESGRRDIAAAIETTFQDLGQRQRRGFACLGAIPGSHFDLSAAAVAMDEDTDTAESILNELTELHLIQELGPDRFGFHDLLRLYALHLHAGNATDVLGRVAAHYLRLATGVSDQLTPYVHGGGHTGESGIDSHAAARAWLDTERANLLALIDALAANRSLQLVWSLASEIGDHYLYRGQLPTVEHALAAGMAAAREAKSTRGLALMHYGLGRCAEFRGRHDEAHELFKQALVDASAAGDARTRSRVLMAAAGINYRLGRYDDAGDCCLQAIELDSADGVDSSPAVFNTLGVIAMDQGKLREAAEFLLRAAEAENRYPSGNIHIVQCSLSMVHYQLGDLDEAYDYATSALDSCRRIGARKYEPIYLSALSSVRLAYGDNEKAYELAKQARDIAVEADLQYVVPRCLLTMAEARLDDPGEAIRLTEQAAEAAVELGLDLVEVETQILLAEARLRSGEAAKARDHAAAALAEGSAKHNVVVESWAMTVLAEAQHAAGDDEAARETAAEALRRHEFTGFSARESRTRKLLASFETKPSTPH